VKFRILPRRCSFSTSSRSGEARLRFFTPLLAIILAAIMLAMVGSVFLSSSVAKASNSKQLADPVLIVDSVDILPGQSGTLQVVLSEAPNGVSGFRLDFTLNDPAVAEIVAVSLPNFGLIQTDMISSSHVTTIVADLNGLINAGDTNTTLSTLNILGTGTGSTQINVVVNTMDDDDGFSVAVPISAGTVSVSNVASVVDAGPDIVSDEGQAITSTGSFTDPGIDTWTATVDYGDGAGPQPLSLNGQLFDLNHTYVEDGSYEVSVTVTDSGGLSGTGTALVTVLNVAPVVLLPSDITVDNDFTYMGTGSFTDPGADTWTATVDYGDGSGVQALALSDNSFSLSHDYGAYGVYLVTVTLTDDEGMWGSSSFQVEIRHVCPLISGSANSSLDNDADLKCEDLNGNERLDFSDVVLLFRNLDASEVLNNVEDFDFNDNGLLDMADVIALFEMIIA